MIAESPGARPGQQHKKNRPRYVARYVPYYVLFRYAIILGMETKKIGIIFGGRSSEHEISVMSGAAVLGSIDTGKYEPIPFFIDKTGNWYIVETSLDGLCDLTDPRIGSLASLSKRVTIADFDDMTDFAFPLLHGPYGEDGTIQGLFEMLGKPYAGCGVTASAVSMDKIFMKDAWEHAKLPIGDFTDTTRFACGEDFCGLADEAARIESEIPYPIFVKPANMGSSVGISRVEDHAGIEAAIRTALKYDDRVIAESGINGREIEIALTGNDVIETSAIGEILPDGVYYDYDSKYRSEGTTLIIPADLPDSVRVGIEELAVTAYKTLDGAGYSRIDLFYDEEQGRVYLNEMNSIPGFTRYSMFPMLWREKGVGFTELVERIIELGYERHFIKNNR